MGMMRQLMAESGDPFSLRRPKWARKLTLKKALSAVAPALEYVPGVGQGVSFARSYGLIAGDPGKKTPKRKSAGAGPQVKAAKKADKRKSRAVLAATRPKKGKKGPKIDWGKLGQAAAQGIPVAGNLASELIGQLNQQPDAAAGGGGIVSPDFGAFGAPHGKAHGFGGHRRTMNPGNVKALRRSLRRVESFERLVKSIERAYPRLKRATGGGHSGGARGHKRGCRCAVCK